MAQWFAGAQRDYVGQVAGAVKAGVRCFQLLVYPPIIWPAQVSTV